MQIQNATQYDNRTVAAIVRWALREKEVDDYVWSVRVAHHTRGHAWHGRWYHARRHAVVRIAKQYPAQCHVYKRRDVPEAPVFTDWREALVWGLGHELEHARQQRARKPAKESETEWAAYRLWQAHLAR